MPMHDWTRVEPNEYHDFHNSWLTFIKSALNNGGLPPRYEALTDHTAPPYVPDVVTLYTGSAPPGSDPAGVAVATAPGSAVALTEGGRKKLPAGRRRVAVRDTRGDRRIVAVIEVVSPSNKRKKDEFHDLVGKSVELLRQGAHVVLVDPLPPTRRDPHGLHAAVWKELTGKPYAPPPDKPLTLAGYAARGDDVFSAYVEPTAVGDPLNPVPLFVTPDTHVLVPLEATYRAAWQTLSARFRAQVEGR